MQSDQGAVWESVDDALRTTAAASDTAALRDAMAARPAASDRVAGAADDPALMGPLPGQTGIVVALGRTPVAAEVFDRPSTLSAYWADMMRGLAVEADRPGERPPGIEHALRFVRCIRHGERTTGAAVGLGRGSRLELARQVGSTLEWEGALVHLTTYALEA